MQEIGQLSGFESTPRKKGLDTPEARLYCGLTMKRLYPSTTLLTSSAGTARFTSLSSLLSWLAPEVGAV